VFFSLVHECLVRMFSKCKCENTECNGVKVKVIVEINIKI